MDGAHTMSSLSSTSTSSSSWEGGAGRAGDARRESWSLSRSTTRSLPSEERLMLKSRGPARSLVGSRTTGLALLPPRTGTLAFIWNTQ